MKNIYSYTQRYLFHSHDATKIVLGAKDTTKNRTENFSIFSEILGRNNSYFKALRQEQAWLVMKNKLVRVKEKK